VLPGSVAEGIAQPAHGDPLIFSVEHPSGEFTVMLEISGKGAAFKVARSGILRTARALFEGQVFVPASVWSGR
jgi:4-oxalomesaconate tautomerase